MALTKVQPTGINSDGPVNLQSSLTTKGNYSQMCDYGEIRFRASDGANLNGWRITHTMNGLSDGSLVFQHSTDNFVANFTYGINITNTGNVGIGIAPLYKFHIEASSSASQQFTFRNTGTGTGSFSIINIGNDTSATQVRFIVGSAASSAWAGPGLAIAVNGGAWSVWTGSPIKKRLEIDTNGNVLQRSTGALGYGAGSGGAVTQATSKSTAVLLDTPSGKITMNNAALAAGASVSFQLNNSLVTINDTAILCFDGSVSAIHQNYRIAYAVGSGAIFINITNVSAGSLSEALVINFTIIKGSLS